MPRRRGEEINKDWKYSSVTLPKDFIYYLDEIIMRVGQMETQGTTGTFLPSRRAIVQDAVEMYVSELYPEMHAEYVEMLKDCGMYQRTQAHEQWRIKKELKS